MLVGVELKQFITPTIVQTTIVSIIVSPNAFQIIPPTSGLPPTPTCGDAAILPDFSISTSESDTPSWNMSKLHLAINLHKKSNDMPPLRPPIN